MEDLYNYTGEKLSIRCYATPEMYGAIGDGANDDTEAIQKAVSNKQVYFFSGKTYKITTPIVVKEGTFIDMKGSTLLSTNEHAFYNFEQGDSYGAYDGNGNIVICNGTIIGGCISFIHGEHIRINDIYFKDQLNDHCIEICACKDYHVERCSFIGMRHQDNRSLEYINIDGNASYAAFPHNKAGQSDEVFYDMSSNSDISISNCFFKPGTGNYSYGFNAIGVHSRDVDGTYADNISIANNSIDGFSGCGLRINGMRNVYISGNHICSEGDGIRVGDVADCDGVVIINNFVTSETGRKLALTDGRYANLTVSGNITEGDSQEFN